jgi:hypothetical protein
MYYLSNEITADNDNKRIKKLKALKNKPKSETLSYRVYVVNNSIKDYKARGYWIDKNELYRDKIIFKHYKAYNQALKEAETILNTTKELAVSIEDIKNNILYIIYKDNHIILRVKYIYKTVNKRKALNKIKEYSNINGGVTLEYVKGYYIISSYK